MRSPLQNLSIWFEYVRGEARAIMWATGKRYSSVRAGMAEIPNAGEEKCKTGTQKQYVSSNRMLHGWNKLMKQNYHIGDNPNSFTLRFRWPDGRPQT